MAGDRVRDVEEIFEEPNQPTRPAVVDRSRQGPSWEAEMRKKLPLIAIAALLMGFTVEPVELAGAETAVVYDAPRAGAFTSDNITYVGTIPLDSPGVGGRVVQIGEQTRFYVTGVNGLTIYDVTDPALPVPLGYLPLKSWENEDVSVSADGSRVLISEFTGTYMYVVDITETPTGQLVPKVTGFIPDGAGHTVECVDPECSVVYGSEGSIMHLETDPATGLVDINRNPNGHNGWRGETRLGDGHNVNVDAAGYVMTDTVPMGMLDISDPLNPVKLAGSDPAESGGPGRGSLGFQHNNKRPRADDWATRDRDGDGDVDDEVGADGTVADVTTDQLRPGELMITEGETNFTVDCEGEGNNGMVTTWDMRNWDVGREFTVIDTFEPISGDWADGNPAINALGCSGHWFEQRYNADADRYEIAAGWYEHGTRVLSVDPQSGEIGQLGFFQPVVGSTSAAYWVGDDYIYSVDYERGVDILRFDPDAPTPTTAELDASWLAKLGVDSPISDQLRFQCRLGAQLQ